MRLVAWLALAVSLQIGCKKDDGISRDLGASCQSHVDCTEQCLPEPRWPGGFCTLACDRTDECPVGGDCVATSEGDVCLFLCFDDRDCGFIESPGVVGDDWTCQTLAAPGGAAVQACAPPGDDG